MNDATNKGNKMSKIEKTRHIVKVALHMDSTPSENDYDVQKLYKKRQGFEIDELYAEACEVEANNDLMGRIFLLGRF
jgi:hypothetical protein